MKWITHIALAFFIVKVTEIALMIDLLDSYWAYAVVFLFAVLPDFDFLLGIKHRGINHTIWFTLIALILLPFGWKLALAGWIAVMSHLFGDMMTHSGVKLLFPFRETVFYLVPPRWRFRTGSSAEFMILGVLLIGGILLGSVSAQSDVEKVFTLSKDHFVTVRLSTFENGARYDYGEVKIVWTDGKNKIGFIEDGHLHKISRDQILKAEIVKVVPANKVPDSRYLKIKDLRRAIWRERVIVAWEDDGVRSEFVGTGKELYEKLKDWEDCIIGVWYYETR